MKRVVECINFKSQMIVCWSDSTTVLHWISSPADKWKPYVSNRVKYIQSLSLGFNWCYVNTECNPADIVSRGLYPDALMNSKLWWHGPNFLTSSDEFWNQSFNPQLHNTDENVTSEAKRIMQVFATTECQLHLLIQHLNYSDYIKSQNVLAWIKRFIHNCRFQRSARRFGVISTSEAREAETCLLILMQKQMFPDVYNGLQHSPSYTIKDSQLKCLSLFMGEDKLIRVGGRLNYTTLAYSIKHPILLHHKHFITIDLFNFIHRCHLHVGPQGLLAAVRQRFWPISGRSFSRNIYRNCVICMRVKPKLLNQKMGSLPTVRVSQAFPFQTVAVDYCGPFFLHYHKRGKVPSKTFLAVFVCLCTKAVHLEVAADLSTVSFMATLRRFTATRGLPSKILSDNGTNFCGANNLLKELFVLLMSSNLDNEVKRMCQQSKIEWSFIPPNSPHFGGLHEAAVKSAKLHLRKMTANAKLTFDEFYTLIKQVEAALNSRPLSYISSDDTIDILTPGHFLIGRAMTSIPEPCDTGESISVLKRWDLVQSITNHFWKRWSLEYVRGLQQRHCWGKTQPNVKVNSIVIIKDDNLPPLKWKMGRVLECHFGPDGNVRVVTMKTSSGIIKRAITNIAILPVEHRDVQGGEDV